VDLRVGTVQSLDELLNALISRSIFTISCFTVLVERVNATIQNLVHFGMCRQLLLQSVSSPCVLN
jgi:hypothetical protein